MEPQFEAYTYLKYAEMRKKIEELKTQFPEFLKVSTAEEEFGIKHRQPCNHADPTERCQVDILRISNWANADSKKQVYFSGTLHGDEIIGPHSVYYLAEYLLVEAASPGSDVSRLLDSLEVVLTPMTNAVGYFNEEREERMTREVFHRTG